MANSTVTNSTIFRIDTFGADVNICTSANGCYVNAIIMEGATAGDTATFIDTNGDEVLRLSNDIGTASKSTSFAQKQHFPNGLIFDDSASDLAANDFIFIYLAD